jgi:putative alpha-1,2-mannosidase
MLKRELLYSMALLLGSLLSLALLVASTTHPEEFPNLLAGSFTDGNRFSTGNTLPLVGRPWGFNHWAPQTRERGRHTGSWWFFGSDHTFSWLRCTHQPSPWIGDWGYFHFVPQIGHIDHSPRFSWEPRAAVIKPYLFDATIAPFNIRMELTPSEHGAMFRVTFPSTTEHGDKYVCFATAHWKNHGSIGYLSGGYFMEGEATDVTSDRMIVSGLSLRIRAESSEAIDISQAQDMLCFKYPRDAKKVVVKISTSLISMEQAIVSMQTEIGTKSFDDLLSESKTVWRQ